MSETWFHEDNSNLASVHKYFGGVGWTIENFRRQTFLTPPSQAPKLFEPPFNKCKNFFWPPPLLGA